MKDREMVRSRAIVIKTFCLFFVYCLFCFVNADAFAAKLDTRPPAKTVKLVFIHHSTGENWLADNHGGLANALQKNHYFVSDTNYGWGPDGIGDRTDIINWPEWFTGPNRDRYMAALFRENEVHSPFRRTVSDSGGENRVIMFKSCFPNSELTGRPNDPPRRGGDLTVANAKAIYKELLTYFTIRPDKLFVAITAPPLSDAGQSRNARAFNNWLVHEWLKGYKGKNVAVFDFYNELTGSKNRHYVSNGKIVHVANRGRNTLAYPSGPGDDHPSTAGGRKATADFVPMLNAYVNQWIKTAPPSPPTPAPGGSSHEEPTMAPAPTGAAPKGDMIDNFETNTVPWQAFLDGQGGTRLTGGRDASMAGEGKSCLRIDYQVADEGWATYSLVYEAPQNWKSKKGLTYYLHTSKAGVPVILTVHGGRQEALTHFEYKVLSTKAAVNGWQKVVIPWSKFMQPDWEGDGKAQFDPSKAMGLAFVFSSEHPGHAKGALWVDDVRFIP